MLKTLGKNGLVKGLVSIIMMFAYSCGQNDATADEIAALKPSLNIATDTIFSDDRDTMILVKDGEAFVKGHIKDSADKIKYTMPVWSGQNVIAVITSLDTGAHIRIWQVKLPGEKIKSSPGKNVDVHINSSGNFNFIVGRSLKADEKNTGDFLIHITVK